MAPVMRSGFAWLPISRLSSLLWLKRTEGGRAEGKEGEMERKEMFLFPNTNGFFTVTWSRFWLPRGCWDVRRRPTDPLVLIAKKRSLSQHKLASIQTLAPVTSKPFQFSKKSSPQFPADYCGFIHSVFYSLRFQIDQFPYKKKTLKQPINTESSQKWL